MTDQREWVIWNGAIGILDIVRIGTIEDGDSGRKARLASPYDVVGPFSLDELETRGSIAFGECLVMSRQRWQEDQIGLRIEAQKKRRAFVIRSEPDDNEQAFREILNLPVDGPLTPSEIKAAFRLLAKTAHPDAGGSNDHYRRIAEARDVLLGLY